MKTCAVVLYAVPAVAFAHPGHAEGYHSLVHPEVLFLAGCLVAGFFPVRKMMLRLFSRIR